MTSSNSNGMSVVQLSPIFEIVDLNTNFKM